jgi:xanthine/uracil/vitamin C permease (AzgA family)
MGNYAAKPIVFLTLFGISMLITVIVVAKAESSWKYAIVILPVSLVAALILTLWRTAKHPDPAGQS